MTIKELIGKLNNKKMRVFVSVCMQQGTLECIQESLNIMGKDVYVDGLLGVQTIKAIKEVNNNKLIQVAKGQSNKGEDATIASVSSREPVNYLEIARTHLGLREIHGSRHEPKIIQFHEDAKLPLSKITDEIPWCGSFVTSCLLHANVPDAMPKSGYRAKSWLPFGVSSVHEYGDIGYGSIAVKSRKGGGHVCFVVGKSEDGKYLYCLGGNQGDKVSIARYRKSVFMDFRLPKGQDFIPLPVITGGGGRVRES